MLILSFYLIKNNFTRIIINSLFIFLLFDFLAFCYPLNSSSIYLSNSHHVITSNDFIRNEPIIKPYGPLLLDINNMNYKAGIIFIPMLNTEYKPLFLAVNCKDSLFNIKDKSEWNNWFNPFFTYEINILNDLCGN